MMKGVSLGGTSVFPNDEIINISQLNGVALVGGIGNFSKVDLSKALAGKRASFRHKIIFKTVHQNNICRFIQ